jgi:hypothetical protein
MKVRAKVSPDRRTVTLHVPFRFRRRGGRKLVIAPDGNTSWSPPPARIDDTIIKALGRARRWTQLLESGQFTTVAELATAEKINLSYLCRILRLTLLSPKIVEHILDGRQPADLLLKHLMRPFPVRWNTQEAAFLQAI